MKTLRQLKPEVKITIACGLAFIILILLAILIQLYNRNSYTITVVNNSHETITVVSGYGTRTVFDTVDIRAGVTKKIKFRTPLDPLEAFYIVGFEEKQSQSLYRVLFFITDYDLQEKFAVQEFHNTVNLNLIVGIPDTNNIIFTISQNTDGN